ncbi:response regulator transcription factor [Chitinophaga defluvii]|uniref:Response regulator transcription factor n=1 Tax=Chitinophaga defluvii TaxID=3163343 RepID=A0ABV2T3Y2_9BACT
MKLLIIEDEPDLLAEIVLYMTEQGFLCETAITYSEAEDKLHAYEYEVIILDIGLPGGSGLDLLLELKAHHPESGILIISAKDSLRDKLTGLDMGADDYITKPFYLEELNSRINALLRRKNFNGNTSITLGVLTIDTKAKTAFVNENTLSLTLKEYALLQYFVINKNRVLSKQAIAEHLWGDDYDMADNYHFVYVHINNLRKKIQAAGGPDYIHSIYGMGYKFAEI